MGKGSFSCTAEGLNTGRIWNGRLKRASLTGFPT